MKANELMLNDLVLYRGRIHKVEDIALNDYIYLYSDYCYEEPEITDVSPIPLTAEILEKNGFEIEKGLIYDSMTLIVSDKCVWWCKEYGLSITKYPDEDNVYVPYICNPSLVYVHELQHALRLCGLTELADNFKVE